MKKSFSSILWALAVAALAGLGFWFVPLPGSDEDLLLSIHYDVSEDEFVISLRNMASHRIRATVNAAEFFGSITVVDAESQEVEYFVDHYLQLISVGTPDVPVITMDRNAEVLWTVPRTDLRSLSGDVPTRKDFDGARVFAKSGEIVPMPNGGDGLVSGTVQLPNKVR